MDKAHGPQQDPDLLVKALEECAREPIQRPGLIQPDGVLLSLDPKTLRLMEVSTNVADLFDLTPEDALGQGFEALFGTENARRLEDLEGLGDWRQACVTRLNLDTSAGTRHLDVWAYYSGNRLVLEVERRPFVDDLAFQNLFLSVRDSLWRLDAETDIQRYTQAVVDQVRRLTGHDRVMMYRFDTNWDGEVVAEARAPGVASYLGHRFPASDIPPQARELYTRNQIRLISDIDAMPVPVIGQEAGQLDMTYSGLRSFSPVHIEYLRNMGVRSSLSISLIQNNRLWGLIACHHMAPLYVPFRVREFYEFIGKTASLKLSYLENLDKSALHERMHHLLNELTWVIRKANSIDAIIETYSQGILSLVQAEGGSLCLEGVRHTFGKAPACEHVEALVAWLKTLEPAAVFHTHRLGDLYPAAQAFLDTGCGLMVAPLNHDMSNFLMWFRPAAVTTVRWAGKPEKSLVIKDGRVHLSPRESFATWVDTYQDQAKPWTALEIDSANALALAVIEVLNQRALKSSEEHYRLMADHSTDMILRVDRAGACTFASPACKEILGYAPGELVGSHLTEFILPEDHATWQGALTLSEPGKQSALLRFAHREGNAVWIEAAYRLLGSDDPNSEIVLNARDVTQRHTYQLAIEDLHQRNAKILDATGEGVISLDTEGRVIYVNARAALILGRTAADMIGKTCFEAIQLLDAKGQVYAPEECPLFLAMKHRETYQNPKGAMRHQDGHQVDVEYVCTPLIENKTVTGCVVVFRAITETGTGAEVDTTTHVILDQATEAVMVTDHAGHISSVNRAFTTITGYTQEEALGATPKLLKSGIHTPNFYNDLWDTLKREGRWVGEIWNRRKNGEIYPQWGSISAVFDLEGRIRNYVAVFSDTSKAKQAEDKLFYLANHDVLTDLPNRLQFTEHLANSLERARRQKSRLAVLFMDLDRFKIINDSLGHHVGDQYLQHIAMRLKKVTRRQDALARWGGDEFIMMVEQASDNRELADTAQRVMDTLSQPLSIGDHEFIPTASLGISLFPDDATALNDLVKAADAAMYRAKENGRNAYEFYTSQLTERIRKKLEIGGEIRRALKQDEFELHYQTQIEARGGTLAGLEALVRWRHPVRGMLMPMEFVPLAEEIGMIQELGDWVLLAACKQMRAWREQGVRIPRVAVNVSPTQLNEDLVERIRYLIRSHGLQAHELEIEITEGALESSEKILGVLHGLRSLGITLSVDDFGTGYSSLSHIKDFPINCFKIDKSFVDGIPMDMQDVAIIRTILALGGSLQVKVVAEGVETLEQFAFLKEAGVDTVQGYLFSRPASAEQVAKRYLVGELSGTLSDFPR